MRFDRVITNPPFSQNYTTARASQFPRALPLRLLRRRRGKKADLMFVQHMLAVLRAGGMVATVMPHGVLFRGGAEKDIRTGFIEDDLLEAVIGLPPNLFYGTGIPACILVLRAQEAPSRQRRAPGQGAVHQRRPRVLRRPRAELPAPRAHREDRHHLRRLRRRPRLRGRRDHADAGSRTTTTSTSAATPTTRRRPSRTTCAPTCWAACPRPR